MESNTKIKYNNPDSIRYELDKWADEQQKDADKHYHSKQVRCRRILLPKFY